MLFILMLYNLLCACTHVHGLEGTLVMSDMIPLLALLLHIWRSCFRIYIWWPTILIDISWFYWSFLKPVAEQYSKLCYNHFFPYPFQLTGQWMSYCGALLVWQHPSLRIHQNPCISCSYICTVYYSSWVAHFLPVLLSKSGIEKHHTPDSCLESFTPVEQFRLCSYENSITPASINWCLHNLEQKNVSHKSVSLQ